jgi:hypothetical protein
MNSISSVIKMLDTFIGGFIDFVFVTYTNNNWFMAFVKIRQNNFFLIKSIESNYYMNQQFDEKIW